jgi:hypothetical protein
MNAISFTIAATILGLGVLYLLSPVVCVLGFLLWCGLFVKNLLGD